MDCKSLHILVRGFDNSGSIWCKAHSPHITRKKASAMAYERYDLLHHRFQQKKSLMLTSSRLQNVITVTLKMIFNRRLTDRSSVRSCAPAGMPSTQANDGNPWPMSHAHRGRAGIPLLVARTTMRASGNAMSLCLSSGLVNFLLSHVLSVQPVNSITSSVADLFKW